MDVDKTKDPITKNVTVSEETPEELRWNEYVDPVGSDDPGDYYEAKAQFFKLLRCVNYNDQRQQSVNPLRKFICTYKWCYKVFNQINGVTRHHVQCHCLCGMVLADGQQCTYKFKTVRDIQDHTKSVHGSEERNEVGEEDQEEDIADVGVATDSSGGDQKRAPRLRPYVHEDRYRCVDCFLKLLQSPHEYNNLLPYHEDHMRFLGPGNIVYTSLVEFGPNACCKKRLKNMRNPPPAPIFSTDVPLDKERKRTGKSGRSTTTRKRPKLVESSSSTSNILVPSGAGPSSGILTRATIPLQTIVFELSQFGSIGLTANDEGKHVWQPDARSSTSVPDPPKQKVPSLVLVASTSQDSHIGSAVGSKCELIASSVSETHSREILAIREQHRIEINKLQDELRKFEEDRNSSLLQEETEIKRQSTEIINLKRCKEMTYAELAEYKNKAIDSENEITALKSEITRYASDVKEKDSKIEHLNGKVKALEIEKNATKTELENRLHTLSSRASFTKNLQKLNEDVRLELIHVKDKLTEIRTELETLRIKNVHLNNCIGEKETKINDLTKTVIELKREKEEQSRVLEETQSTLASIRGSAKELQEKHDELLGEHTTLGKTVEDMRVQSDCLEKDLSQKKCENSKMVAAHEKELSNYRQTVSRRNTTVMKLNTQNDGLRKKIGEKDFKINQLLQRVEQLEGEVKNENIKQSIPDCADLQPNLDDPIIDLVIADDDDDDLVVCDEEENDKKVDDVPHVPVSLNVVECMIKLARIFDYNIESGEKSNFVRNFTLWVGKLMLKIESLRKRTGYEDPHSTNCLEKLEIGLKNLLHTNRALRLK